MDKTDFVSDAFALWGFWAFISCISWNTMCLITKASQWNSETSTAFIFCHFLYQKWAQNILSPSSQMQTTYCEGQIHLFLSDVWLYEIKKVTVKVSQVSFEGFTNVRVFPLRIVILHAISPFLMGLCHLANTPQPKIPNAAMLWFRANLGENWNIFLMWL